MWNYISLGYQYAAALLFSGEITVLGRHCAQSRQTSAKAKFCTEDTSEIQQFISRFHTFDTNIVQGTARGTICSCNTDRCDPLEVARESLNVNRTDLELTTPPGPSSVDLEVVATQSTVVYTSIRDYGRRETSVIKSKSVNQEPPQNMPDTPLLLFLLYVYFI